MLSSLIVNGISLVLTYYLIQYFQAIIFVDNSGADIILGILPFARELLRRGTEV